MLHGILMAGGSGTRFWPRSRRARPKHLLNLAGDRTLLQQTWDRCRPLIDPSRLWVVTHRDQADETQCQLPDLRPDRLIVEPCGRSTAPCIGIAAHAALAADPDATLAVLPTDHVIEPSDRLREAIAQGAELVAADSSRLVVFGIPPTFAATGYGYIERGQPLTETTSDRRGSSASHESSPAYHVTSFREKPDVATAEAFLQSGNFLWNSGLFVWKAATILDELQRHEPAMANALRRIGNVFESPQHQAALQAEYPSLPSISIDYAVLERAGNVCVIEASFAWDDLGSWESLARRGHVVDSSGNIITGSHSGIDTRNCLITAEAGHLIATIGVEDLLIVQTPDATLVARRGDEAALRRLIEQLRQDGYEDYL